MRKVERSEVVDFQTYNDRREGFRQRILEEKAKRRIHVGEYLTFLFESTDTILYQVQEMMRIELIVREKDVQHEIDTYNQLLGAAGELGCTLLIEIDNPVVRDEKLRAWLNLPAHVYMRLDDGSQARAQWDHAQISDTRLSSVQYLKFSVGAHTPVGIGCDHPELSLEVPLSPAERETLTADLT